jgi:hypothetical protein
MIDYHGVVMPSQLAVMEFRAVSSTILHLIRDVDQKRTRKPERQRNETPLRPTLAIRVATQRNRNVNETKRRCVRWWQAPEADPVDEGKEGKSPS